MKSLRHVLTIAFFTLLMTLGPSCASATAAKVQDTSWLGEVRDYELPEWFTSANRVHSHTRLTSRWIDKSPFVNAGKHFGDMGFEVMTRHIVSGGEGAWWPSKVGTVLKEAKNRNFAKEIIDEAHASKRRIIVYYRHMEDRGMARAHPEWLTRDPKGKPYVKRGEKLCFNTPYRDFVQTRLLELVDMGADGFYFDEKHQPEICRCATCKANKKTREDIIRETFLQFRTAIHKRNPECVLLVSSQFGGLSHSMWRLPDICKFEQHIAFKYGGNGPYGLPLGFTFTRDAADGTPTHYWWSNQKTSTLYTSARTLAFGHIFNFDVKESGIADPDSDFYKMARRHTALGRKLSRYLNAAPIPVRWAIIHYPEGTPQGEAKTNVVLPVFKTLATRHAPIGIITNTQLREGIPAECMLLVFPNSKHSITKSVRVQRLLAAFKARGGVVIRGNDKTLAEKTTAARPSAPVFARAKKTQEDYVLTAFRDKADTKLLALLSPNSAGTVLKDAILVLPKDRTPAKAIDVMTGKERPITKAADGRFIITLPTVKLIGGASITWKK
ncbi:MAG: hypothetical protein HN909_04545 [Phycisphaerales bacterium]|jgi:hypothetical protein|nr:hypothetical protein [Phycisphaerales bacterium]MBT7171020.1 hypothetical protein [Phycisphaerales bacterium]